MKELINGPIIVERPFVSGDSFDIAITTPGYLILEKIGDNRIKITFDLLTSDGKEKTKG